VDQKI